MRNPDRCVRSWGRLQPGRRAVRDPEVAALAEVEVRAIREELAAWVRGARRSAGLAPREVAERMGYERPERGMSKLARWERGDEAVWADRIPAFAQALGASTEQLATFAELELRAVERAEASMRRRRQARPRGSADSTGVRESAPRCR